MNPYNSPPPRAMFAQRHFTLHVKVHRVKGRRTSAPNRAGPARGVDEVSKVVKSGAEDVTNVADFFHSNLTGGLADESVVRNRQLYGGNVLPAPKLKSIWEFAVDALEDVTLRILILCAFVSVVLETSLATDESGYSWLNGAAILLAVAIIVGVECANNYEKQAAFTKLNSRSQDLTTVCVVRNGGTRRLVARSEIVAGDVILLEAGDIAPADCVVFDGRTLLCDQAHLTGESDEIRKTYGDPVYAASKITCGRASCLVCNVGRNSSSGQIAELITQGPQIVTPLQEKLGELAIEIGRYGISAAILVFVILASSTAFTQEGIDVPMKTIGYLNSLETAITVVVVSIPEVRR